MGQLKEGPKYCSSLRSRPEAGTSQYSLYGVELVDNYMETWPNSPEIMSKSAVLVPIKLHAFVASEDFPESQYHIAPLIQPNYAALRTDELLRHDIIEQLDLSAARLQAKHNTRFVDVTSGQARRDRVGVYLSWTLPRVYRSGMTATPSAEPDHDVAQMRAGFVPSDRVRRVQATSVPPKSLKRIGDAIKVSSLLRSGYM